VRSILQGKIAIRSFYRRCKGTARTTVCKQPFRHCSATLQAEELPFSYRENTEPNENLLSRLLIRKHQRSREVCNGISFPKITPTCLTQLLCNLLVILACLNLKCLFSNCKVLGCTNEPITANNANFVSRG